MDVELSERWLSQETGLSRDILREHREKNLAAGDHRKGSRGQIVWEITALDKLSAEYPEFATILENLKGGEEGARKALGPSEAVDGLVTRMFANPHLIGAELPGNRQILVRVHDNKNFRPGMKVKARPAKDSGAPWVHEGRCPRWPGRY